MITLLHGDNTHASRAELHALRAKASHEHVVTLDGRNLDETSLTQAVESTSLFGGDTVIFIENLFGKLGRKTKLIESLATILRNSDAAIILWEGKEIGVTVIKSLGNPEIKLFKFPAIIFQLLDGLAPQSAQKLLPLYRQVVEKDAPEIVQSMIARRVRQLIQLSDGVVPEGLAGWQASRLTRQAKLFTINRLTHMYKQLLEMEYSVKNGSSPFTLTQRTEQFLIDL